MRYLVCWFLAGAAQISPASAQPNPLATPEIPVWGRFGPYDVAVVRDTWKDARRQREVPVKIFTPRREPAPFR